MQQEPFCVNEIEKWDYTRCPYEKSHSIHKDTKFLPHINQCGARMKVVHLIKRCKYNPNHIFIDLGKLSIHLGAFNFSCIKEELSPVIEKHLFIDSFVHADKEKYPGLREIEETSSHNKYLAAYLYEDSTNPTSVKFYKQLAVILTQQHPGQLPTSIAICNQSAGSDNLVWLIVHKKEASGFGDRVNMSELGLFCIPSTFLYGRKDKTQGLRDEAQGLRDQAQGLRNQLKESREANSQKDSKIEALVEKLALRDKTIDDLTHKIHEMQLTFKTSYDKSKQERDLLLNIYKLEASQEKETLESRLRTATDELEWGKQEKARILHNSQLVLIEKKRLGERVKECEAQLKASEEKLKKEVLRVTKKLEDKKKELKSLEVLYRTAQSEAEQVKVLTSVPEAQSESNICGFCLENTKNTVNVPCGHIIYCNKCLESHLDIKLNTKIPRNHRRKTCEVCEAEVEKVINCFAY